MLNLIFKMQNLSDFSYFLLNIRKAFSQLKIFWRIFMRQISLTDYFCKGLMPLKKREKQELNALEQELFPSKTKEKSTISWVIMML